MKKTFKIIIPIILVIAVAFGGWYFIKNQSKEASPSDSYVASVTAKTYYFYLRLPRTWKDKYKCEYGYNDPESDRGEGWCFIYDSPKERKDDLNGLVAQFFWVSEDNIPSAFFSDEYWAPDTGRTYCGYLETPDGNFHLYRTLDEEAGASEGNGEWYDVMLGDLHERVGINANEGCTFTSDTLPARHNTKGVFNSCNVSSDDLGMSISEYKNKYNEMLINIETNSSYINMLEKTFDVSYEELHSNMDVLFCPSSYTPDYIGVKDGKVVAIMTIYNTLEFQSVYTDASFYTSKPAYVQEDKIYYHLCWEMNNGYIDVTCFNASKDNYKTANLYTEFVCSDKIYDPWLGKAELI
ncbi:MAG: hypothetical protein IJT65_06915 [Eubacterium sp.]|nr:hypothetical protein [Eubacterium sp.]